MVLKDVQKAIVIGLERACWETRRLERVPGWARVYPRCGLARLSFWIDKRWQTGTWRHWTDDELDRGDDIVQTNFDDGRWHAW